MPNTIPMKDLQDEDGLFYPNTKTDAVYDNNGNSLEDRLEYIISDADWTAIQARHGR